MGIAAKGLGCHLVLQNVLKTEESSGGNRDFEGIWEKEDQKQQSKQGEQSSSLTQVTIGQYIYDVCHNKLMESHQCGKDPTRTSGFVAF